MVRLFLCVCFIVTYQIQMLVHTRAEFVKHTKRSRREFFFSKSNEFNDFFFHPSLFFQIWLCLLRSRSIGAHNKWIPVLMQSKRMREQQSGYKFIHWIVSVVVKFCIVFAALRVLFARTYNEAMRVCAGVFLRQHKISSNSNYMW